MENKETWTLIMTYEAGCESSLEEECEAQSRNEIRYFGDCSVRTRSSQSSDQGIVHLKYPLNSLQQLSVSSLCFTQTSIAVHFSGAHQQFRIDDAVGMILSNDLRPENFPTLEVMQYKGFLWSFNNRRLWVFKKAKISVTTVLIVSPNHHKNRFRVLLEELQGQPQLFSKLTRNNFLPKVRGRHKTNFSVPGSAQTEKLGDGNNRKRIRRENKSTAPWKDVTKLDTECDGRDIRETTKSTPVLETVTKVHPGSERKQTWRVRQHQGGNRSTKNSTPTLEAVTKPIAEPDREQDRSTKKSSPPSENITEVGTSSNRKQISTPILENVTEVIAGSKRKQIRNKTSSESIEEAVKDTGAGSEHIRSTTKPKLPTKAITKKWKVITMPDAGSDKQQIKDPTLSTPLLEYATRACARSEREQARSIPNPATFYEDVRHPYSSWEPFICERPCWVADNLPTTEVPCAEIENYSDPSVESRSTTNSSTFCEDVIFQQPSWEPSIGGRASWVAGNLPTSDEPCSEIEGYSKPSLKARSTTRPGTFYEDVKRTQPSWKPSIPGRPCWVAVNSSTLEESREELDSYFEPSLEAAGHGISYLLKRMSHWLRGCCFCNV